MYKKNLMVLLKECSVCYIQFFDPDDTEEFYKKFKRFIDPEFKRNPRLDYFENHPVIENSGMCVALRMSFELVNEFISYGSFRDFADIFRLNYIEFISQDEIWLSYYAEFKSIESPNGKLNEYLKDCN